MIVQVEPVKLDGQHWVNVIIDSSAMDAMARFPLPTRPRAWPDA